jgi:hypothetical protein
VVIGSPNFLTELTVDARQKALAYCGKFLKLRNEKLRLDELAAESRVTDRNTQTGLSLLAKR